MMHDSEKLQISLQQMGRVIRALDDLKKTVLRENPENFAVLAEAYLEDLERLHGEIEAYLIDLKTVG